MEISKLKVAFLPSNSTLKYITKIIEDICLYNLYVNVHNGIIHNSQKVEITQISSNE